MSGIKSAGHGLKRYAEYREGPERKEPKLKLKAVYKKVGKHYKKVYVRSKHHKPQPKTERGFIESNIMRPTGNWGGLGGYK
jgi:hypothetical protein